MPFSSGIFQRLHNWVTDRDSAIKILASRMDGEFNNYADAINDIVDGTQPFTGTVKAPFGTVASPGFQFDGDSNTGLTRTGADTVALVTNGVARLTANTTALTSTLPFNAPSGAAAAPSLNFTSTDGFWSPGGGVVALSLGGVERLRWAASGVTGTLAPVVSADRYRIINGDFAVNQSGVTSGSALATASYPVANVTGGRGPDGVYAIKFTADTVSFGTTAGYRPNSLGYSLACAAPFNATSSIAAFVLRIENAATYSGQVITLFARMNGFSTHDVSVSYRQNFGTGGAPSADVSGHIGKVGLTAGWNPYKFTFTVPSVSGKTFGTNNDSYLECVFWIAAGSSYSALTNGLGTGNRSVWFSDIHERLGDVPITAIDLYQAPDPQQELARCMRYYQKLTQVARVSGAAPSIGQIAFPVAMRATPTETITYNTGSGATWAVSRTGMVQTSNHSGNASVTQLILEAEL